MLSCSKVVGNALVWSCQDCDKDSCYHICSDSSLRRKQLEGLSVLVSLTRALVLLSSNPCDNDHNCQQSWSSCKGECPAYPIGQLKVEADSCEQTRAQDCDHLSSVDILWYCAECVFEENAFQILYNKVDADYCDQTTAQNCNNFSSLYILCRGRAWKYRNWNIATNCNCSNQTRAPELNNKLQCYTSCTCNDINSPPMHRFSF